MRKLYVPLLALVIFLAPTNLFLKFFEPTAYVNGLLVDYLLPKLYLSDVPILFILGMWFFESIRNLKRKSFFQSLRTHTSSTLLVFFLLLIALTTRQFLTSHPWAALWYGFKLLEMFCFGWFLVTHRVLFQDRRLQLALLTTIIFQSSLAIYQYLTQSALFGYWFLGEPNLGNPIGLARTTLDGVEKVLPYGTTAHPNILAGLLVIYFLLATQGQKVTRLYLVAALVGGVALFLTYSVSAWLALALGLTRIVSQPWPSTLKRWSLVLAALALIIAPFIVNQLAHRFPDSPSVVRRAYLNEAAVRMTIDHPLIGVGLNNFTAQVEKYSPSREVVRFVQPVHHVGLLWLAETGLLGMLVLIVGTRVISQKFSPWLLVLLPLVVLDHYLLTTQTGLLLGTYFLASSTTD